jgi:hypothetical protein
MRHSILITALLALLVLPALALAQTPEEEQDPPNLDPTNGTIVADLAPLPGTNEFASGNAIIYYVEAAEQFEVQVSASGLKGDASYELVLGVDDEFGQVLGSLTTDAAGNGHLHATPAQINPFDRVKVIPASPDATGGLSSLEKHGGSLRQSP